MTAPIAVSTGFTWTTALVGVLNLLVGGVLVALIKSRPALKKIANEREANLLNERAEDMESMRSRMTKLETKLEQKDIIHEAERAYDRHRINNLATSLNGFLMMVKANPGDAAKAAIMIEELRVRQIEEENKESIALRALVAGVVSEKPPKA